MKIGPCAQAIVDNLAGRPAEIIAREPLDVQATFRAFFTGASSPARMLARDLISCGHDAANEGWPACWDRLMQMGLVSYFVKEPSQSIIVVSDSIRREIVWQITAAGWKVRMDDVAWMTEFLAARTVDDQKAEVTEQ